MFENVNWRDVADVDRELRRDFVVAVQKLGNGRTMPQIQTWEALLREGRDGKQVVQFWRSMSQSLQFDVSQLMTDKIGEVELERQLKKQTNTLIESARTVLAENPDVYCHPSFFAERKAFLLTLFWYIEYVRLA